MPPASPGLPAAPGAPAGTGLQLDGVNDYVTFGAAPGLNASTFTIETWFKRTGTGVGTATSGSSGGLSDVIPLLTKGRSEDDTPANVNMNWFLGIDATTNTLAADFEDTATGLNHAVTGTTVVTSNVWHHAAATYDGTTWRLYLDGYLDRTLAVGAFTPEATSIQHAALGTAMDSTGTPDGYFAGVLDEARVWNVARSQAQIVATKNVEISVATTGLLGRWGLNEGSGSTVSGLPAAGAGVHNGTYTGGYTPTAGLLGGDSNGAVALNGIAGSYVTIPDEATLDQAAGPLSWELWFKRDNETRTEVLIGKGPNAPIAYFVGTQLRIAVHGVGTAMSYTLAGHRNPSPRVHEGLVLVVGVEALHRRRRRHARRDRAHANQHREPDPAWAGLRHDRPVRRDARRGRHLRHGPDAGPRRRALRRTNHERVRERGPRGRPGRLLAPG